MDESVDLDFSNMSKEEALKKYVKNMKKLEQAAKKSNINGYVVISLELRQLLILILFQSNL